MVQILHPSWDLTNSFQTAEGGQRRAKDAHVVAGTLTGQDFDYLTGQLFTN